MKRTFDLILFDMDGTLYPHSEQCKKTYYEVALKLISKHYGMSRMEATSSLEDHRKKFAQQVPGRTSTTLVLLHYYSKVTFAELSHEVNLIHPVESVLGRIEASIAAVTKVVQEYDTLLYTMNNEVTTQRVLDTIGMNELFPKSRRYTLDTWANLPMTRQECLAHIKPGLLGFEKILTKAEVSPEKSLMVGDSLTSDIRPAKKLQMETYHVKGSADLQQLPTWLGL